MIIYFWPLTRQIVFIDYLPCAVLVSKETSWFILFMEWLNAADNHFCYDGCRTTL